MEAYTAFVITSGRYRHILQVFLQQVGMYSPRIFNWPFVCGDQHLGLLNISICILQHVMLQQLTVIHQKVGTCMQ